MQWEIHAGNLTTYYKSKVSLRLPELNTANVLMWECHLDDYTRIKYTMILCRDLLKALRLNLKRSKDSLRGCSNGPFERCTSTMLNLGTYD